MKEKSVKKEQADPHVTPSKVREFKRGNINFDFLQPSDPTHTQEANIPIEEKRDHARDGKRGLFNRGRKVNPVSQSMVVLWYSILLTSIVGLVWSLLTGTSILQLLIIPMFTLTALGSLMMIALVKARPG